MRFNLYWAGLTALVLTGAPHVEAAGELRAGAAHKALEATDDLVIGGGIGPGKATGQEGELRASAVVIEAPDGSKVCLVACDVLMIERDILDPAARAIEKRTGIPFDQILINATHTHHAPTTCTIHGYSREETFTKQVGEKIVEAAVAANAALTPVQMTFRLGEESSVGRNSRLLLGDGTIFWVGTREDTVRPTGPFDPELPVVAFVRPGGKPEAVLFNHSTHTIGTLKGAVRSPSFYGLAAQELEKERGGTFLFFEGASGSTHNLDLGAAEAMLRIKNAVTDALDRAEPRTVPHVTGKRRELTLKVRHFDEAADDAAVTACCKKPHAAVQRQDRRNLPRHARSSPRQGEEPQDLGPGHHGGRHRIRGRAGGVLHDARPGNQAEIPLPLHLRLRAGQRLRRLHPDRAADSTEAGIRSGQAFTASWPGDLVRRSSKPPSSCFVSWTLDPPAGRAEPRKPCAR
ncbi:MAG: hypothetical protein U0794_12760 [Isosphaeraceae bacterium]